MGLLPVAMAVRPELRGIVGVETNITHKLLFICEILTNIGTCVGLFLDRREKQLFSPDL